MDIEPAKMAGKKYFTASTLKTIAIAAMVIDHLYFLLLPPFGSPLHIGMRFVGRITGPIMFYFIAEGYHHTKDTNRYTLRLGIFAVVSYLPFIYFVTGGLPTRETFLNLNVIYTLFLGHLALRVLHEVKDILPKAVCLVVLLGLSVFGDWGIQAIAIILVFDLFRNQFTQQAMGYGIIVALTVLDPVTRVLQSINQGVTVRAYYNDIVFIIIQMGMFIPLLLLYFYNGEKGRENRWFFYIFYPAHLVVLSVIRVVWF